MSLRDCLGPGRWTILRANKPVTCGRQIVRWPARCSPTSKHRDASSTSTLSGELRVRRAHWAMRPPKSASAASGHYVCRRADRSRPTREPTRDHQLPSGRLQLASDRVATLDSRTSGGIERHRSDDAPFAGRSACSGVPPAGDQPLAIRPFSRRTSASNRPHGTNRVRVVTRLVAFPG